MKPERSVASDEAESRKQKLSLLLSRAISLNIPLFLAIPLGALPHLYRELTNHSIFAITTASFLLQHLCTHTYNTPFCLDSRLVIREQRERVKKFVLWLWILRFSS
jgi:hypothetical protein